MAFQEFARQIEEIVAALNRLWKYERGFLDIIYLGVVSFLGMIEVLIN